MTSTVTIDPDTWDVCGPVNSDGFFDVLGRIDTDGTDWYFLPEGGPRGSQIAIPTRIANTHDLSAVAEWISTKVTS